MKSKLFSFVASICLMACCFGADDGSVYSCGFEAQEGYVSGSDIKLYWNADVNSGWTSSDANKDQSKVVLYGSQRGDDGLQYLSVNTDGSVLENRLQFGYSANLSSALKANDTVYFDGKMWLTPMDGEYSGLPEPMEGIADQNMKFAVYALVNASNTETNLAIWHAFYDPEDDYELKGITDVFTDVKVNANEPVKLHIELSRQSLNGEGNDFETFFSVRVNDGFPLQSKYSLETSRGDSSTGQWFRTLATEGDEENCAISAVAFEGTGMVDSLDLGIGSEILPEHYNIIYRTAYGTAPATQYVSVNKYGDKYALKESDIPAITDAPQNCTFKGWGIVKSGITNNVSVGYTITNSVRLVASWDVSHYNYSITYVSAHGTVPSVKKVQVGYKGDTYILTKADLPSLKASGYTFGGWSMKAGDSITDNVTLTALWTEAPVTDEFVAGDSVPGIGHPLTVAEAAYLNGFLARFANREAFLSAVDNDGDDISLYDEFLLGLDPTVASEYTFGIGGMSVTDSTVDISVKLIRKDAGFATTEPINGCLVLTGATTLLGSYDTVATSGVTFANGVTVADMSYAKNSCVFFKAKIAPKE